MRWLIDFGKEVAHCHWRCGGSLPLEMWLLIVSGDTYGGSLSLETWWLIDIKDIVAHCHWRGGGSLSQEMRWLIVTTVEMW